MMAPHQRFCFNPAGRMLEVRHWMVKLNRGIDFVSMDDILVDLKLTAEVSRLNESRLS